MADEAAAELGRPLRFGRGERAAYLCNESALRTADQQELGIVVRRSGVPLNIRPLDQERTSEHRVLNFQDCGTLVQ